MYPYDTPLPERADAIIVLSGGMRVSEQEGAPVRLAPTTVYRCLKAAEVYHHAGPCLVVASGDNPWRDLPGRGGPHPMKDLLIRLNVDPRHIVVEDKSRTTYENAVETCKLIEGRELERIVLVTDAVHLFRSTCCFEALGCPVIPVGCNYQAVAFEWTPQSFVPSPGAVLSMQQAFHEWAGIVWYWLRGRLS
jgi:uncharacterized SAM-binding protein YcdF (DUF218 family)